MAVKAASAGIMANGIFSLRAVIFAPNGQRLCLTHRMACDRCHGNALRKISRLALAYHVDGARLCGGPRRGAATLVVQRVAITWRVACWRRVVARVISSAGARRRRGIRRAWTSWRVWFVTRKTAYERSFARAHALSGRSSRGVPAVLSTSYAVLHGVASRMLNAEMALSNLFCASYRAGAPRQLHRRDAHAFIYRVNGGSDALLWHRRRA